MTPRLTIAMPETIFAPDVDQKTREELTPLFHVVLLDDDDHTYDYVVEMLQKLFMKSSRRSFPARR